MAVTTPYGFAINTTTTTGENVTGSDNQYAQLNRSLNIMSIFIFTVDFLLGVSGNGLVIWVTGFLMKKTVNTVWFLNLAVADFCFTASLPMSIVDIALQFHWPFGKFMCMIHSAVIALNMYASVYILMVISIDRCVAVVFPVWAQNHRTVKKAFYVSLCVWALALIFSIPHFAFLKTGPLLKKKDVIICYQDFVFSDNVTEELKQLQKFRVDSLSVTHFLLSFAFPYAVIVSCYAVIIHRIRKNASLASRSSRTFKIIAAIVIIFFLCWAPFHIFVLMQLAYEKFGNVQQRKNVRIWIQIATSLAFINSCVNPLLYVFIGKDFKDRTFKSILKAIQNAFQDEDTHLYSKTVQTRQSNVPT
ncbi:formyl peptide receptor-related sequence 1-like [Stigmatopora nigra]